MVAWNLCSCLLHMRANFLDSGESPIGAACATTRRAHILGVSSLHTDN